MTVPRHCTALSGCRTSQFDEAVRILSRRVLAPLVIVGLLSGAISGTGVASADPVTAPTAAPDTARNTFLASGGGVSAPPLTVGDHLYVSTGETVAAWDMSGTTPQGPYRTSSSPEDGSITMMAAPRRYLYAATLGFSPAPDIGVAGGGISTYSLADPSHPTRVSHLSLPSSLGYAPVPHTIAATDSALYAIDQYGSLFTYSLADPKNPRLVDTFRNPTNFTAYLNQASSAAVVGTHLLVTGSIYNGDSDVIGVLVYDLTTPQAPTLAGYRQLDGPRFGPIPADSNGVTLTSDGFLLVFGFRLAIFDLRNPNDITMTYGSTSYPHVGVSAAAAVIHGNYAYIATQPYCSFVDTCGASPPLSTDVWDISDRAHPRLVRALPVVLSPTTYNAAADSPAGPVFVGADDSVRVLDLTQPTAPTLRYRLPLLTSADAVATETTKAVFDANGFAYVVGGSQGFSVLNPRTLTPIGRFDSAASPTLPPADTDIAISGKRVYLLDNQGFSIVDVTRRSAPVLLSQLHYPQAEGVAKVAVAGNRAYVATATTVRAYDVADATHPRLVGSWSGPVNINGLAARGTELFVTAQESPALPFELFALNVANPAAIHVDSTTQACDSAIYTSDGLAVSPRGDRAYLSSTGCGRVDIVDVSHPTTPRLLTPYTPFKTPNSITGVTVVDRSLVYVTTGTGVDLVDVSAAGAPHRIRRDTPIPSSAPRLSRSPQGVLLYASFRQEGVETYDENLPAGYGTSPDTGDGQFSALDLTATDPTGLGSADLGLAGVDGTLEPAVRKHESVEVMLQLSGTPAASSVPAGTARTSASRAQQDQVRGQLQAAQDQIIPQIRQAGGEVIAQLQSVYNGVQVKIPAQQVLALSQLPGVAAVHLMHPAEPSNVNGVPFVGAPQAWGTYGNTGRGVKIGILDSGIDYTHADFGGTGTEAAYQYALANDADDPAGNPVLAKQFGPQAPKVKGGYDFVGDGYNAADPASTPQPDRNPLDCGGHGSHVSGTAAGFGVLRSGATFRGPYQAGTVTSHDWKVGPGVAPEADLYAYRVFGCAGSSNVVAAAIDKAVADGMDVINLSLGSDLGGVDDPTTVAAENAAKAGISVVAAAGNAGQAAYITGSPSTGNDVLAVAALDASLPNYPGAALRFSTDARLTALDANGADIPSGSHRVVVLSDGAGGIGLGCDISDYDVPDVAGAVVVTRRGTCARVDRAVYGQAVGAAAVVMVNDTADQPPYEGPITFDPSTRQLVTIPFLGVAGTAANTAALQAADGATVTLTARTVVNTGYEHSASFSSGGPRNPDSAPKPDVIAPGVSVESVGVGTGTGSAFDSGTSMATPMTSGTAALVVAAHPTWSAARIKAAIQNTADPSRNTDYEVRIAGTGVVQAQRAIDSTVLATTADGLNSLAFGPVAGNGARTATRTFSLTNTGTAAATYALAVETDGDQRGAGVTVQPATVTVPAGAARTVTATLTMSAKAFAALPGVDTSVVGPGDVTSVSGAVVATPVHARARLQTLRMVYLLVPRGLSDVVAGKPTAFQGGSASLPVTNNGVHRGTADVYAWGIDDPRDVGGGSHDVRAAGVQSLPGSALGGGPDDRAVVFGVNTWGAAATRSVDEIDIAVDNNQDGWVDYFVIALDRGAGLTGSFSGQLAVFTVDANTYEIVDAFTADAPMNSSIVELPTLAGDIGVDPTLPRLDYTITSTSLVNSAPADSTATASFNAFAPTVSNGQLETVAPGKSLRLPLTFDAASQRRNQDTLGWLVLTADDPTGAAQAAEVAAPVAPTTTPPALDSTRTRPGAVTAVVVPSGRSPAR